MSTQELTTASPVQLREHLALLQQERAAAALAGLTENGAYMADLDHELAVVTNAYIGAAVTEIASLRSALGAPLLG